MNRSRLIAILALGIVVFASAAQADPRAVTPSHRSAAVQRVDDRRGPAPKPDWRGPVHHGPGPVVVVPAHRVRHYHNVVVVRPHGHWYPGYGPFMADDAAYKWLAFTAISLKTLDLLNEQQERAHEAAQVRATTAAVGETIVWNQGGATGSVTAVREGTSTTGRTCREFQQTVTIGGKTEQAYGTACLQADGAWEVVATNN
jgi:hypothetical protein